ncbi:hypothetical protein GCM10023156_01400 [Novipirellula rosea]|uniref:Uncharacterized protein n=1 Tax=Novipirellula rosea TaxID=1031540 RepID=A0ABP8M5K6_9BACT
MRKTTIKKNQTRIPNGRLPKWKPTLATELQNPTEAATKMLRNRVRSVRDLSSPKKVASGLSTILVVVAEKDNVALPDLAILGPPDSAPDLTAITTPNGHPKTACPCRLAIMPKKGTLKTGTLRVKKRKSVNKTVKATKSTAITPRPMDDRTNHANLPAADTNET